MRAPANDLTEGDCDIEGGDSGVIVESSSSFSSSTCPGTCPFPPSVCRSYSCTPSPPSSLLSSSEVTKASSNGSSVGAGTVNGTRADGEGEEVLTG